MSYLPLEEVRAGQKFCERDGGQTFWLVAIDNPVRIKQECFDGWQCRARLEDSGEIITLWQSEEISAYGPHFFSNWA